MIEEEKDSSEDGLVAYVSDKDEETKLEGEKDDELEADKGSVIGYESDVDMEEVAKLVREQEIEIQL